MATLSVVTYSPPETGASTPQGGRGWIVPPIEGGMPKGQRGSLHATRRSKRSCNCREDGDYDVEDFSPGAVVVEGSHSGNFELGVSN